MEPGTHATQAIKTEAQMESEREPAEIKRKYSQCLFHMLVGVWHPTIFTLHTTLSVKTGALL